MEDVAFVLALFIGLPWAVFTGIAKVKAATLTGQSDTMRKSELDAMIQAAVDDAVAPFQRRIETLEAIAIDEDAPRARLDAALLADDTETRDRGDGSAAAWRRTRDCREVRPPHARRRVLGRTRRARLAPRALAAVDERRTHRPRARAASLMGRRSTGRAPTTSGRPTPTARTGSASRPTTRWSAGRAGAARRAGLASGRTSHGSECARLGSDGARLGSVPASAATQPASAPAVLGSPTQRPRPKGRGTRSPRRSGTSAR